MKISNLISVALLLGMIAGSHGTAVAESAMGMDTGAQMERDRRDMERERVLEQIAEDEATKKNQVEKEESPYVSDRIQAKKESCD